MHELHVCTRLSARELEIAHAYAQGSSYREIAAGLDLAPATVRTHLQAIYRKLGVSSKVELYRLLETGDRASGNGRLHFPERPSIAVMPFACNSGDSEQEFFADGLVDDITARLSYLRGLVVVARTSTWAFKGRAAPVPEIAEALGVRYLLEGSVRRSGETVRVLVRLVDGASGAYVWTERFDRDLTRAFEAQDEISCATVVALQVQLTDGDVARIEPGSTRDVIAWETFNKGVLAHLAYTRESEMRARDLFEASLARDPSFTDARVYLAWTYWQDARSGFAADCDAALAICRDHVEAMKAAGVATANALHLEAATLLVERRHDAALEVAARAVRAGPCKLFGYTPAALVNIYSGRPETGLDLLRMTVRLAPYTPNDVIYNLAWALGTLGDHENALSCAEDYMARVPGDLFAFLVLARARALAGDGNSARRVIARFREQFPNFRLADLLAHEPYHDVDELDRLAGIFRDAGVPD